MVRKGENEVNETWEYYFRTKKASKVFGRDCEELSSGMKYFKEADYGAVGIEKMQEDMLKWTS